MEATDSGASNEPSRSPRTVENHLGAVYRKIGVSGRTGLTARAVADPVLRPVPG